MSNAERAHAVLSASGIKKWATCTMSAALEEELAEEARAAGRPEQDDTVYSLEGTCAHAIADVRLSNWRGYPERDETEVPGYERFAEGVISEVVEPFVGYVENRVAELRTQHGHEQVTVLLEQRLDFNRWVPEGFGRGDVVIIYPTGVEVIDLKAGGGVYVDGRQNGQTRLYGLGAIQAYDALFDFDHVTVTIVQPRLDNFSGETLTVAELLHWAEEFVRPRAAVAWAAYKGDRSKARFAPGEHCASAFCSARFRCAARARWVLEQAEMPHALHEPDTLTVDQLESITDRARAAVKWLSDCERFLLEQAAAGRVELKRYELVQGRSFRTITDPGAAAQKLREAGLSNDELYAPAQLKSLASLEAAVGGKARLHNVLGDLIEKPPGKPTLKPKGSGGAPVAKVREGSEFEQFD